MDPGFYALHVHTTGLCDPESSPPDDPSRTGAFLSAGGHLGSDEDQHPEHAGDLPSLYVQADGTGQLETVTDRLTDTDLFDDDGSAVMVHAGHDNFANIPERYAPEGPDEETLGTGDAGDRLACGVVE
ncbi:superoxide dismutase family protein [Cellulomonas sp. NPDC057328]|uniref:superoxide dismutase family protein n=1 Tax=Cellulomonas sp. NPDC057328 TaxID=3346101 RepID=UPI00362D052A